jgi:hypothetical protein
MSKKAKTWSIIVAIVFIVIVISLIGQNSNSEFTVYPVFCSDWIKAPPSVADFSNCQQPQALEREVYKVDMANQQVIESSPDSALFYKLESCTVVDSQTWKCESGASMVGARSRSGEKFVAYGLTAIIFVSQSEWNSINNGAPSPQR